ncbi:MAG: cytochrome oxidase small assembly protein [Ottowia sp.]|nr:cytochrome oxidase small assembly protein [Ottowia sp.]
MTPQEEQRKRNVRLGLILAAIAVALFVGAFFRFAMG